MALQPIARFNVVPHADVTGNYFVGIAAFHKDGVTNCGLRLGTSGPPINISQMSLNPRTGVWEYCLPIPSSLIPDGNYVLQGFAVASGGQQILPNTPLNIWQASATYTDKYVDADLGDDTTGTGAIGAPFLTIKKAAEAFAGNGNGGRVYLKAATANYGLTAVPSVVPTTTTRYLNIEAAPGAAKADVVIDTWATNGIGANKVRFRGVTIKTPIRAASADLATLWMEDCHLEGNGAIAAFPAAGWAAGWSARYFTAGEVTDAREGLNGWDLVSGATFERIGQKALQNCQAVIDVTIDVVDRLSDTTLIPAALSYNQNLTNALAYNVRAFDVVGLGLNIENPTGLTGLTQNMALVNLVFDNGPHGTWPSQVKDHQIEHLFIQNCTFAEGSFIFRTNALADLRVQQVCFRQVQTATGDILGQPILNPANFTDCHFIQGTSYGFGATTGSAGFTSAATDDYTPTAGSVLWTGHSADKLIAADAEHVARDNPTTVGGLRGAAEGSGAGDVPPGNLVYTLDVNPGTTGVPLPPIVPSWDGTITLFELAPSVYHIYKAPAEIVCNAADAHFEVRAWESGDPTDPNISGGHHICLVEDLRFGHIYLRNPKVAGNQAFSAMATAMNLCAPFASAAGSYTNSLGTFSIPNGPTTERPIIRYSGVYLTGTGESSGLNLNEAVDIGKQTDGGSNHYRAVFWAGDAGADLGGFFPIGGSTTTGPVGRGKQIRLSVIGANLGMADKIIGPTTMGYGFKPSGVADPTWAPIDILYKNFTFSPNFFGFSAPASNACVFQTPDKSGKTGRLRLYDYRIAAVNLSPTFYSGYGSETWIEMDGGCHFDFRRGTYPPAEEHANYIQGLNAGLLRNATALSGETPDSWFIEIKAPNGSNRTLFHLTDRVWDQIVAGPITGGCKIPNPAHKCRPGGKGVVLFERCEVLQGSENENASRWNMVTGADMTFILRGNRQVHKAPLGKGSLIPVASGLTKVVNVHNRSILAYNENGDSTGSVCAGFFGGLSMRLNENGYNTRRVVVIDHFDDVEEPNEKRMTFRGVEEVHIYSFDFRCGLGGAKPAIEIDAADSSPYPRYFNEDLHYQFDLEGNLVRSVNPAFGTSISSSGGDKKPHTGEVFLYMGWPALPTAYSGWTPGAIKMLGYIWPSTTYFETFTDQQVNQRAGTPCHLPDGLTLNPTTGIVSGTPTEGIGLDPLGNPIGTLITSPLAYDVATGMARIPIKGSNSSSADAWTDGLFLLGILDTENQFITTPKLAVNARMVPPLRVEVDERVQMPKISATARMRPVFSIVDDGALTQVFAPPIRANVRMLPPNIGDTQEILLPVIRCNARMLSAGAVFGGIEKGDFAGMVVTGGCQDGEIIT